MCQSNTAACFCIANSYLFFVYIPVLPDKICSRPSAGGSSRCGDRLIPRLARLHVVETLAGACSATAALATAAVAAAASTRLSRTPREPIVLPRKLLYDFFFVSFGRVRPICEAGSDVICHIPVSGRFWRIPHIPTCHIGSGAICHMLSVTCLHAGSGIFRRLPVRPVCGHA